MMPSPAAPPPPAAAAPPSAAAEAAELSTAATAEVATEAAATEVTVGLDSHTMFGDEEDDDDFEDDDDDDSEMYDEDAATGAVRDEDLNSSPSSSTDDDDRLQNPNTSNTGRDSTVNSAGPPKDSALPSAPRSQNGASSQPVPLAASAPSLALTVEGFETPEAKRQKTELALEERRSFGSLEDSRRLFQRLWTDEDEIVILQGFYEFTSQRGTTHHAHQHDTGPFYEQIKSRLQLDFTKNQLVEKIRRLKKKYRNNVARMASGKDFAFKSPHDQATFEISRKIWCSSLARGGYDNDDDDANDVDHYPLEQKEHLRRRRGRKRSVALAAVAAVTAGSEAVPVEVKSVPTLTTTPSVTVPVAAHPPPPVNQSQNMAEALEETVKTCLSPLFKELLHCAISGPQTPTTAGASPVTMNMLPLSFMGSLSGAVAKELASDDKWRKQQVLELEVYSKRLELVQEQIQATLEELRSSG